MVMVNVSCLCGQRLRTERAVPILLHQLLVQLVSGKTVVPLPALVQKALLDLGLGPPLSIGLTALGGVRMELGPFLGENLFTMSRVVSTVSLVLVSTMFSPVLGLII